MHEKAIKLINEIEDYIKFLVYEKKLEICICDCKLPFAYLQKLSLYTAHSNSYCQKIKNTPNGQRHCLLMQKFTRRKCKNNQPFFGACYAGVFEYVFPIFEKDQYLGFICVSGYRSTEARKPRRFSTLSQDHENLKEMPPNEKEIRAIIPPLVNCFRLLYQYQEPQKNNESRGQDRIYCNILAFLSENFLQPLTLEKIAEELHYSPSYLAHLFRKKNGKPIMRYVFDLKIAKAKELLQTTNLSVSQISETVGFSDSNYFTAVFKKIVGFSPRKFRNL